MKKICIILLIILLIFTTSCSIEDIFNDVSSDDITKTNKVNIIEINDTHGACLTDTSTTGLDKVQSVITSLEKTDGDYIKIANGDIFQGGYLSNVTEGLVFVDILNTMNFDCFVIGNHEFDWGLDIISKYKDGDVSNGELNCKFLSCNIIDKTTGTRPSWIDEYEIVSNNGYKVGIIGAIGDYLESSISSDKVANYEFANPDKRIKELSKLLREEEKCDLVILSIHEYEISHNETIAAFPNDSRIDGIICGHTHQKINEYEYDSNSNKIPVVQSYTKNGCVGIINYTLDNNNQISSVNIRNLTPSNFPSDNNILSIGNKYLDNATSGEEIIFNNPSYLSKSDLGVLLSNSLVVKTNADIGVTNTGGIRTTLTKGDIKLKDILEVYPFDNLVVVITISGSRLKTYLKDNSGYLYTSNINNIKDIDNNKMYKLATVNYIYENSYNTIYFNNLEVEETGILARECLIEYLKNK